MKERVVLLIDDEENVVNSIRRLLRKEPYTLLSTTIPEEALNILDCFRVALVITDQRMEGITGDELIDEIRRKYPEIQFIKFTGYTDTTDESPVETAWEVIPKPWDEDHLKEVILDALRRFENKTSLKATACEEEK